jgi:uncharacterized protein
MNIVTKVRDFVKNECEKPSSYYGRDVFSHHFVSMVRYAETLVDELGGDREIVVLACWLHDIGSIMYGRPDHHITGMKIAEEKLTEFGYSAERIELIKGCILNHRGSLQNERKTVEEKIVADADALSNFDNLGGLFKAALVHEGKDQGEARDSVREKLERKWGKLHFKTSKKIIKPKYEAVELLLQDFVGTKK